MKKYIVLIGTAILHFFKTHINSYSEAFFL